MARDPLKEVLQSNKNYGRMYNIPLKHSDFFREARRMDLEYFGLTFSQRMIAFVSCMVVGVLCFIYALFNIPSAVFRPSKFAFPYAFSNFLFFMMIGFIFGFRTYFKNIMSKKRKAYTIAFLCSTLLTLYVAVKVHSYIINFFMMIVQLCSFLAFMVSFIPGGTKGLSGVVDMILSRG
ncbi:Syntaxin [Spraguea lophii 42_110]|uniref:Protein transport protein SFT2 n=1 Tax=Spraguea lophii (strain 42_110) TaxID=1358809 RepID=S7XLZ9_SPRLO|nr:Syntaxin [Spraguea lophii 42_110]